MSHTTSHTTFTERQCQLALITDDGMVIEVSGKCEVTLQLDSTPPTSLYPDGWGLHRLRVPPDLTFIAKFTPGFEATLEVPPTEEPS